MFTVIGKELQMKGAPHVGILTKSLRFIAHTFVVVGVVLFLYWLYVMFH